MRCTAKAYLTNGNFQCGAEKGHQHAHVTMDEASGGLVFFHVKDRDFIEYWWYHAGYYTEQKLRESLELARENNAPTPPGISWEIFQQARGW